MQYNKLGKSGLRVSELSFGSWLTFGNALDVKLARQCMQHAFEQGVNFFDNAEGYGAGQSEIVMGEALKDFRREDLVISSKIFWGGQGPNDTGLSRKHLIEGTKNALKRLKLEYLDLLFCHRPDPNTPVEETVLAMDYLVRSGLVLYWGTSEWPAEKIEQAFQLAKELNCIAPTMEQPQYNMLVRDRFEREYAPLFKKYSLGTTVWSPLASGILTGKYNDGIPAGSRLVEQEWLRDRLSPDAIATVRKLSEVAKEIDASMTQLALAWCLKNPNVSTVILGATNLKQLDENLGAIAVKERVNDQILQKIEKILSERAK